MNATPVDFDNPEALAKELEAVENAKDNKTKVRKPPKPKVIKVSYTADRDIKAGETIEFDYEIPKSARTRGIVAGIPLVEMTDDQLKIEYRNANSVYYKQNKAGKLTQKATDRLNAVKAELDKRGIQPSSRSSVTLDAAGIAKLIIDGKVSVDDIQKMLDEASKAVG